MAYSDYEKIQRSHIAFITTIEELSERLRNAEARRDAFKALWENANAMLTNSIADLTATKARCAELERKLSLARDGINQFRVALTRTTPLKISNKDRQKLSDAHSIIVNLDAVGGPLDALAKLDAGGGDHE